jgi:hypothetical protein
MQTNRQGRAPYERYLQRFDRTELKIHQHNVCCTLHREHLLVQLCQTRPVTIVSCLDLQLKVHSIRLTAYKYQGVVGRPRLPAMPDNISALLGTGSFKRESSPRLKYDPSGSLRIR